VRARLGPVTTALTQSLVARYSRRRLRIKTGSESNNADVLELQMYTASKNRVDALPTRGFQADSAYLPTTRAVSRHLLHGARTTPTLVVSCSQQHCPPKVHRRQRPRLQFASQVVRCTFCFGQRNVRHKSPLRTLIPDGFGIWRSKTSRFRSPYLTDSCLLSPWKNNECQIDLQDDRNFQKEGLADHS
jgi:hypothetical protein